MKTGDKARRRVADAAKIQGNILPGVLPPAAVEFFRPNSLLYLIRAAAILLHAFQQIRPFARHS
jgi:hypothetical protein